MRHNLKIFCSIVLLSVLSCSVTDTATVSKTYKYLALGDSYTIGESVCATCKFPILLQDKIQKMLGHNELLNVNIIAKTGWTTSNLIAEINNQNPSRDYDLVTLLIGVNNQYQNQDFSLYETEFPELVKKAIIFANGDKSKVIVVSIPDYAFTPFGQIAGIPTEISLEIKNYNTFAQQYCKDNAIEFVNITDITQRGLVDTELVAQDGLHPSEKAYSLFVERILPKAMISLKK